MEVVSTGYRLEFTSPPPSSGGGRVTPIPQDPGTEGGARGKSYETSFARRQ